MVCLQEQIAEKNVTEQEESKIVWIPINKSCLLITG